MKKKLFLLIPLILILILVYFVFFHQKPTPVVYSDNYTIEQITESFNEVVLNIEYGDENTDSQTVRKWNRKIFYTISGDATQEDFHVLEGFFEELNAIEGFPGIYPAPVALFANLTIHFYDAEDFIANMGEFISYEDADGAAAYWYTNSGQIRQAKIGYRTDTAQNIRNSVLLEELVNALGLGDSSLRTDSIVYQGSSTTQSLSDMDWIILKLLYSTKMKSGMNQEECEAVIKQIFDNTTT